MAERSNIPFDNTLEAYPMPFFVTLEVRNLEAAVGWYRDVLGFQVIVAFPQMAHLRWIKYADLLLRPGDVGHEPGDATHEPVDAAPEPGRGVMLWFQTPLEQIDDLARRAAQAGARIVAGPTNQPWNTRDFVLADPHGYRICFTGGPVDPSWTPG